MWREAESRVDGTTATHIGSNGGLGVVEFNVVVAGVALGERAVASSCLGSGREGGLLGSPAESRTNHTKKQGQSSLHHSKSVLARAQGIRVLAWPPKGCGDCLRGWEVWQWHAKAPPGPRKRKGKLTTKTLTRWTAGPCSLHTANAMARTWCRVRGGARLLR